MKKRQEKKKGRKMYVIISIGAVVGVNGMWWWEGWILQEKMLSNVRMRCNIDKNKKWKDKEHQRKKKPTLLGVGTGRYTCSRLRKLTRSLKTQGDKFKIIPISNNKHNSSSSSSS